MTRISRHGQKSCMDFAFWPKSRVYIGSNIDYFEVKFVGKSGHILFNKDLDGGNSNQPLIWPVVYSHSAQFALIDRNVFENMWKDARDREREVVLSQTNLHSFFQKISKQTFLRVISEKCKLIRFAPGQLVLPIHHRSPWNNNLYKKYAQKQLSVLELTDADLSIHTTSSSRAKRSREFQKH